MLFRDVADLAGSRFRPRVTIVGTGPAGLSLALRLQMRKVPCLLVEAGGDGFDAESQSFYRGSVVGDPDFELHEVRLRQFGGTSGHWTGWVVPLDASDFAERAWVPDSGWPITKADLDPYCGAADAILRVPSHADTRTLSPDVDLVQLRFSPPVRFGADYRGEVERSPGVGLLLNTAVQELVPGQRRIDSIKVVEASKHVHDLRVEHVCLCTGGIENSRLLLWSNERHGGGVVPHPETLGRYWMEHLACAIGDAVTFNGYEKQFETPSAQKWYFAPSDRAKKAHAIGGSHTWMEPHADNPGKVKALLQDAMCVAPDLSNRLLKRAGKELYCGARIVSEFEQLPRAENRIELDRTADALGVPRARLHWKKSDAERRTALMAARLIGAAFVERDIGRLRMRNFLADNGPWSINRRVSRHHMGGTRMAASHASGIVDRNCRVFGMENLFVGGSSVFATGGHANPTYTIVQLALRLADHLAAKVGA